jgi:hypothetical protein
MSIRLSGCCDDDPELGIVTPGDISGELATINAAVENLNRDVTQQLLAPGKEILWVNRWRAFREEWKKFYEASGGLWARLWGSTYDELEALRKRYETWERDFQTKVGGEVTGPALPPPPVRPPDPGSDMFTTVKRVAIVAGAVVGALFIAPYAVKQIAGARRAHREGATQ